MEELQRISNSLVEKNGRHTALSLATNADVFKPNSKLFINSKKLQNLFDHPLSWSQERDEKEDLQMAKQRFHSLMKVMAFYDEAFLHYKGYCTQENLNVDHHAVNSVDEIRPTINRLINLHQSLFEYSSNNANDHQSKMIEIDQIYRTLLNLQISLARVLSWTASAYRSSKVTQFFNGAKTKKEAVNYDRVQSPRVNFIENQFMDLYGFDKDKIELLVTCSGTAAYSLLERYLAIHILKPGDKVLITPTMYDEYQDWAFRDNPSIEVVTEDVFSVEDILEQIHKVAPKAVFIDPLKNRQNARLTDIVSILRSLNKSWQGDDLYIIIDDTMLAGAINPFVEVEANPKLKILLCSSCGKYLEIGQDTCMAGIVAYPKEFSKRIRNIRMFQGTVLSDTAAWSFPPFDKEYFFWRMRRMTRNALVFTEILSQYKELHPYFKISYPALPDHPDSSMSNLFPYLGGVVNVSLIPEVENPKETLHDTLDEMIIGVIEQAKLDGTSVCWGEAVGFSIPRISVHFEWLWRLPPYLRLVAGDKSIVETMSAAHSIAKGLIAYVRSNDYKFIFDNEQKEHSAKNVSEGLSLANLQREDMSFFR